MAKDLITKTTDAKLVLSKARNLLDITNKLLKNKNSLKVINENLRLHVTIGHSENVSSVAITPDGKYIVSGSSDKTIKLWEISSGKEILTYVGFKDDEYITYNKNDYYNCSNGAYKYFDFFDGNKEVDKNHPIYKQKKVDNFGIKFGKIIDKYPNGVPQTDVGDIDDK